MFETTKFKILEIVIQNRHAGFDAMQVALIKALPEMSWEEISSFVALLGKDGYLNNLYGDNVIQGILVMPDALARLYDAREKAKSDKTREIIDRILKLAPLAGKLL